ncbi:hypothetical protein C8R43DRAFT_944839 [Mycena crocata]|nr:hypothetical protein C8R43DRAFT_944839 [Mycena crocata]
MRRGRLPGRGGAPAPHRRKAGGPSLYEHRPDTAAVVRSSSDNRRAYEDMAPVQPGGVPPAHFQEDFQTNAGLEDPNMGLDMGEPIPIDDDPVADGIAVKTKAKRYKNSAAHVLCYGTHMFCRACMVEKHAVLPTHWAQSGQEWNGTHFKRVGLAKLGLVMQLDHTPGVSCPAMKKGKTKFTLIDVTGIHNVNVQFCECDSRITHRQQLMRACWWPATVIDPATCATISVIRLFHNLNCLGKVSAFHFLRSLELLTNKDGLAPVPNRRRAFMYIVWQYIMTEPMKRAGRGHTDSGVGGTAQGELVPLCRGCPQFGKNVAEACRHIDWSSMPEDLSYKYFTFLAQDCNFRLINRDVSTEARDPVIDDGLGFFCNREEYKVWLRRKVDEEDISTCSGFRAMFLANTKRIKGLRATGVGGVTCARHNMWQPNGIGDLQAGERYCNMDFILFSALLNSIIMFLILSYDIACQYSKNLWTRMKELPGKMHLNETTPVWFKVPNFHILGHKFPCHAPFSFHFMWGGGKTDGEDVEQNWEFTNGAAGSTKMMGLGCRHAFLEALFSFHNWMRTVSYRRVFPRRLARDLKEGQRDREAFESFTALLEGERPELVAKWRKWVKEWESEAHMEGVPSPFEMTSQVHSMNKIQLRLAKAEMAQSGTDRVHTASAFIAMGLEIEQSQRILAIDLKAQVDPSPLQELDMVKRKTALLRRIKRFRKLRQNTYMPRVERSLTRTQRDIFEDTSRSPEMIRLFLPSELTGDARKRVCEKGLDKIEDELREAELGETLDEMRTCLRTRTMTARFRLRNHTGQRALTRGQGILRQINIRIHKAKLRYRTGLDGSDDELIEVLRVEWCKAYSRTRRWNEDVVLVDEEMGRTIEFGAWSACTWRTRATARNRKLTPELAEGLNAYAMEHVEREERTCLKLAREWQGLRERAKDYLAGVPADHGAKLVVELGEEEPESDDEGDLEGDDDVDGVGEREADEEEEED